MTDRHSRREFMGLTAAGVAGALTPPWLADARGVTVRAAQSPEPELIVHNAKVYTIDPAMPSHDFFGLMRGAIGCLPNSTPAA